MTQEEIAKLQQQNFLLLELLATIHGDGGHYTALHGVEKSIEDAHTEVLTLRGQQEGNLNYRVFYEELVSKILGDYGGAVSLNGPIMAGQIAAAKVEDAVSTLRTVRATLQMKLGRGVQSKDVPEVGGTPEGFVRAIDAVDTQGQGRGRNFERALIASWLSLNPTDVNMELAFAGENPYLWLVHAIHAKRHEEQDGFPF
jgi:hypothetical protein